MGWKTQLLLLLLLLYAGMPPGIRHVPGLSDAGEKASIITGAGATVNNGAHQQQQQQQPHRGVTLIICVIFLWGVGPFCE
jgi:hypothetical protein